MSDFALFDLPDNAPLADVRAQWKRLARRHHPDSPQGDGARFAALNAAYDRIRAGRGQLRRHARSSTRKWSGPEFSQPPSSQPREQTPQSSDEDRTQRSRTHADSPRTAPTPVLEDIDLGLVQVSDPFGMGDTHAPSGSTAVDACRAMPGEREISLAQRAAMARHLHQHVHHRALRTIIADRGGLYPDPRQPAPADIRARLPETVTPDRIVYEDGGWVVHLARPDLPNLCMLALPSDTPGGHVPLFEMHAGDGCVHLVPMNLAARDIHEQQAPVRVLLASPLAQPV